MFENKVEITKAILVAADIGEVDCENSLNELEELCKTDGAEVVARVVQSRSGIETATFLGSGKLEEIAQLCESLEPELLIFDAELTATQIRNIEAVTKVHVIDRTMLILDIFAGRATTAEGRLQVALAQERYRLPRLTGMGVALSRLGGGIGTRGPGESKLETDKRHIRRHITALEAELAALTKRREQGRARRKKDGVLTAAIVGYTNAGKSTLLNALTGAGVLAENKLFATLDITARSLELPDGRSVLLFDTVGLIRNLPHHLIEAFKSTLEEAANADLILHIIDASNADAALQLDVTRALLSELGCDSIPQLDVLNKIDAPSAYRLSDDRTVSISAKTGEGLDALLSAIVAALPETSYRRKLLIPYEKGGLLAKIRADGKVFSEECGADGTLVDALVDRKLLSSVEEFTVL